MSATPLWLSTTHCSQSLYKAISSSQPVASSQPSVLSHTLSWTPSAFITLSPSEVICHKRFVTAYAHIKLYGQPCFNPPPQLTHLFNYRGTKLYHGWTDKIIILSIRNGLHFKFSRTQIQLSLSEVKLWRDKPTMAKSIYLWLYFGF